MISTGSVTREVLAEFAATTITGSSNELANRIPAIVPMAAFFIFDREENVSNDGDARLSASQVRSAVVLVTFHHPTVLGTDITSRHPSHILT
jgi:hypothetical protein